MIIIKTEPLKSNEENYEKSIITDCGGEYGGSFNDC